MMKRNITLKKNAYFTVETALVLPLVMGALILTVFLFLFQYDRCLLEQDVNILAIYAGTAMAESVEKLEATVHRRTSKVSMEKYVAWEMNDLQVIVKGNRVSVRGGGQLTLPLPEWNFFGKENVWETQTLRETQRITPAAYIRLYRKVRGGE